MTEIMKAPSEEEYLADFKERYGRPKPPPSQKTPEQKLAERRLPDEAIYQDAVKVTTAALERAEETYEDRRQKQIRKEFAEHAAESPLWRALVHWRQQLEYTQERLRSLDGEIPERGIYDPVRRFEREMRGK